MGIFVAMTCEEGIKHPVDDALTMMGTYDEFRTRGVDAGILERKEISD